jgi:hypothetical protein
MKKLFFAILIFFSFETYSQYLTPKYSGICTDYPFVNISINNILGANLMKWTSIEMVHQSFQLVQHIQYTQVEHIFAIFYFK